MKNMEKFDKKNISSEETASKVLTGCEGLDLLKSSTSKVDGIRLADFLQTPEGKEAMKKKKIVLAGPPRSGKSCLRQGIKDVIRQIASGTIYPYTLTACPDGEGAWFQESMNNDPALAAKLKAEYKSKFTPEFVTRIAESVDKLSLPLSFIDIGGITSPENEQICASANGAILICGETAVKNDVPAVWKEFFNKLNIPLVAELYSDYQGEEDVIDGIGEDGVFRGSVHHLERGENLTDRETIRALSEFIIHLGEEKPIVQAENEPLSIEQIKLKVDEMIELWQEKLPEVEIVLGGSLVSGLFILDDKTKVVDVDVRFLTDKPITEELQKKIEAVTGLQYRKIITVSDWPNGQSEGMMIEGKIDLPDFELPLDVEGCLRNKKYVGWGKFYKEVLSPEEIADFLSRKKLLREDKIAYKALKQEMLRVVMKRSIERGLVSAPDAGEN